MLDSVDNTFTEPQLDRGNYKLSALVCFNEGFTRFNEQNQKEIDRIEDVKIAFKNGKIELIDRIRGSVKDFKRSIRAMTISIKEVNEKYFHMTQTYGLENNELIRGSSTWPTEDVLLQNIGTRNFDLSTIRVKEIRYYKVGSILSLQYYWSNGVVSSFAGQSGLDRCSMSARFPEHIPVRKVRIKASKNWVNEVHFLDANDEMISEIRADSGVGEWHDICLEEGERIIGFQESHDAENYVRRFGLVTLKPFV